MEPILQVSIPKNINLLDFIYAFLFLIPGFLSYKGSMWNSANRYDHSDFEKLAWSLLGSGVALSIYVLAYTGLAGVFGWENNLLNGSTLDITVLAPSYLFVLLIAFIAGYIAGIGYDRILRRGQNFTREDSWYKFAQSLLARKNKGSHPVSMVITDTNDRFEGYITFQGTEEQNVLLACEQWTDLNGEVTEFDSYRYIYFPESAIKRVETDADLSTRAIRNLQPAPEAVASQSSVKSSAAKLSKVVRGGLRKI